MLQGDEAGPDTFAHASQLLMSSCWQTTAQLSLMLGTLADILPWGDARGVGLSAADVERMWGYFERLAITTKHNGATERSQPGLLALASRCVCHVGVLGGGS